MLVFQDTDPHEFAVASLEKFEFTQNTATVEPGQITEPVKKLNFF